MKQVFSFVALLLVQHVLSLPTALNGDAPYQEQAHGRLVRRASSWKGVAVKRSPDNQFDQSVDPSTTLDEQNAASAQFADDLAAAQQSGNSTRTDGVIDEIQAAAGTSNARVGGPHNVGWMHYVQSNLFGGGWRKARARARRSVSRINTRYSKDRNIADLESGFNQLTVEKPENETVFTHIDHSARAHTAAKSLWITSGLKDIVARNEPVTVAAAAKKLNVAPDILKRMIAARQLPQHLAIHRGDKIGLAHRPEASLFQSSNLGSLVARDQSLDEPECPPGTPCGKHAEVHRSAKSLFVPRNRMYKRQENTTATHDPKDINGDGIPDTFRVVSAERHIRHSSLWNPFSWKLKMTKRQDTGATDNCHKTGWMHFAMNNLWGRDDNCGATGPSEQPSSGIQLSQTPDTAPPPPPPPPPAAPYFDPNANAP